MNVETRTGPAVPTEPRETAPWPGHPKGSAAPPSVRAIAPAGTSTALAVDLPEAARLLSVSVRTVRREIDRGHLRAVRIGRVWRVRLSELDAYLKRMEN